MLLNSIVRDRFEEAERDSCYLLYVCFALLIAPLKTTQLTYTLFLPSCLLERGRAHLARGNPNSQCTHSQFAAAAVGFLGRFLTFFSPEDVLAIV